MTAPLHLDAIRQGLANLDREPSSALHRIRRVKFRDGDWRDALREHKLHTE